MTRPHAYTVKELTEIGGCVRQWACKRLHRMPDPKHPAAEAGIQMHNVLEEMLKHGPQANVNPEDGGPGQWARALFPLAPPGCHAELESAFEYEAPAAPGGTPELWPSSFRIDFVFNDFSGFGDWKSCAGAKWALCGPDQTPAVQQAALANDLQANLESYGFMKVTGRREVQLLWLYVDKRTFKAWPVRAVLTWEQVNAWLAERALPRMRLIKALRSLPVAPAIHEVPHELTQCGGTGKFCAFLGNCMFKPATNGLTTERLYQLARV